MTINDNWVNGHAYAPFWSQPYWTQPPGYYPWWPPMNKYTYTYCPQCGIKLEEVMGYVCNKQGCPVFPQVTCELK